MNKGDRRRQRRRYRVRYDRIVIFALILTAVIVLMTSCVLGVTGKGEKPQKRTPEPKTSQSQQTTAPAKEKSAEDGGKENSTKENTVRGSFANLRSATLEERLTASIITVRQC